MNYILATEQDAKNIGGSFLGADSIGDYYKCLIKNKVSDFNCKIKDEPAFNYSDNLCIIKDDLEMDIEILNTSTFKLAEYDTNELAIYTNNGWKYVAWFIGLHSGSDPNLFFKRDSVINFRTNLLNAMPNTYDSFVKTYQKINEGNIDGSYWFIGLNEPLVILDVFQNNEERFKIKNTYCHISPLYTTNSSNTLLDSLLDHYVFGMLKSENIFKYQKTNYDLEISESNAEIAPVLIGSDSSGNLKIAYYNGNAQLAYGGKFYYSNFVEINNNNLKNYK